MTLPTIDGSASTRDLLRLCRVPPEGDVAMPENLLWKAYLELRRRGEPQAAPLFIHGLRTLHRRRTLGGGLGVSDADPEEHRLAEDAYLGELWRSYKRCLAANRTGPAGQILREVEQQLHAN